MKKRVILIAILIVAIGLASWHFLFRKTEQKIIIEKYSPEITKDQKFDPNDKSLATIWILQKDGKIRPVIIRKGITDGTYTEIKEVVWGKLELYEGDEVITDAIQELGASIPKLNLQQIMGGVGGGPPRR